MSSPESKSGDSKASEGTPDAQRVTPTLDGIIARIADTRVGLARSWTQQWFSVLVGTLLLWAIISIDTPADRLWGAFVLYVIVSFQAYFGASVAAAKARVVYATAVGDAERYRGGVYSELYSDLRSSIRALDRDADSISSVAITQGVMGSIFLAVVLLHPIPMIGSGGPAWSPPVGTVVASAAPPSATSKTWLPCYGQEVSCREYPELCRTLSETWGAPSSHGKVRIPDLRGLFLRGVDSQSGRDPDSTQRVSIPGTTSATGPMVGSYEADAFAAHSHVFRDRSYQFRPQRTGFIRGMQHSGPEYTLGTAIADINQLEEVQFVAASSQGGSETRPKNAAVVWLIRAR